MIRLRVLGPAQLTGPGGEQVLSVLAQPKRLALLVYLAATDPPGFHRRDELLVLFWPNRDASRARAALRSSLHYLRRSLGAEALPGRGDEVRVDPERVWSDVQAFREMIAGRRPLEALELYRGDLLDGFHVDGAVEFDRWLEAERGTLRRMATSAALAGAESQLEAGELRAAAGLARQAGDLSSFDETVHRRVLGILNGLGDHAGALRLHERFVQRMTRELEARPSPETEALVREIRSREVHRAGEVGSDEVSAPAAASAARRDDPGQPSFAPEREPLPARGPRRLAGLALVPLGLLALGYAGFYLAQGYGSESTDVVAAEGRSAAPGRIDPSAYADFLRGQDEWYELTTEGWLAAIEYFERAVERDSAYAPAYAMMSAAYTLLGYYSEMPPTVLRDRAWEATERAVALDPGSASAHASRSLLLTAFDWDWEAADRSSRHAMELGPEAPLALIARSFYLTWMGRHDEALALKRRAVKLYPSARWTNSWLTGLLFLARRYDEAIEQGQRALAIDPDSRDAQLWLMYSYAKMGMYDEATRANERLTRYLGSSGIRGWKEAWILGMAGHASQAIEILERIPRTQRETPTYRYLMAAALGEAGAVDRAIQLLERAYQDRSAYISLMRVDPRLDPLREDPRFQELLRQLEFPGS